MKQHSLPPFESLGDNYYLCTRKGVGVRSSKNLQKTWRQQLAVPGNEIQRIGHLAAESIRIAELNIIIPSFLAGIRIVRWEGVRGGGGENWLLSSPPATYGDIGIPLRMSTELFNNFLFPFALAIIFFI